METFPLCLNNKKNAYLSSKVFDKKIELTTLTTEWSVYVYGSAALTGFQKETLKGYSLRSPPKMMGGSALLFKSLNSADIRHTKVVSTCY